MPEKRLLQLEVEDESALHKGPPSFSWTKTRDDSLARHPKLPEDRLMGERQRSPGQLGFIEHPKRANVEGGARHEQLSSTSLSQLSFSESRSMSKVSSSPTTPKSVHQQTLTLLAGGFAWLTRASWLSVRLAYAEWRSSHLSGTRKGRGRDMFRDEQILSFRSKV